MREEGGFEFKKAILEAIFDIIDKIPDAANEGLLMLCEFIEDCEFASLSVRVLHLLAAKGPQSPQPGASFVHFDCANGVGLFGRGLRAVGIQMRQCQSVRIRPVMRRGVAGVPSRVSRVWCDSPNVL